MTGYGAYMFIVWNIWLRHCLNYRQNEFELVWPRMFSMPVVEHRKAGSHWNGAMKKEI
jgi:dihydroceramidase